MDNPHLLIVVTLLSFGTGHAMFRSKFDIMTMAFLSLFIYFIYFQIQGAGWSIIAISSFVAGIGYAYRESSEGMLDDWLYRIRESISSVKTRFSFKRKPKQPQSGRSNQQAYEAEQARREQEAKVQRQRQKNQNEQQEKPQYKKEQPKQEKAKKQQSKNHHQQKQKESIEKNKPVTDTRTNLEILGLEAGFTQEELKKAYRRENTRTHPDKWATKPEAIQKAMVEEQKLVNKAYDELKI